jgi:hypothetical protein
VGIGIQKVHGEPRVHASLNSAKTGRLLSKIIGLTSSYLEMIKVMKNFNKLRFR